MANFDLVAGDGGTVLRTMIRDRAADAPVNLTGKTVTLRYSLNGGATVQKTMTLLDQSLKPGQAEYQFLTTDVPAGGELIGEVRLQSGLADQLTTVDRFHLLVGAPLP
jgi:hypothetical protein